MLPSWSLLAALTVVFGFAGLMLLRRRSATSQAESDRTWAQDFSVEKYRPMQRLLCREDYAFLESQPGYKPAIARTLRKERRRVFRSYLRSIRRDFNRLYQAAKASIMVSQTDETALVRAIVRQRAIFYWALALIEIRLALYTLGVAAVDVRPVLNALEAMREATRILEPATV